MYIGKISLLRVDLHYMCGCVWMKRVMLICLRVAQAGSNARKGGGSDASAFRALSIHSPKALERTFQTVQYIAGTSSSSMIDVSITHGL